MTAAPAPPALPTYQDGHVLIGHCADTGEPVTYTARDARRVHNGVITGGPGTGKTVLAEHIAEILQQTGTWLVRHVNAHDERDTARALHVLTEVEQHLARPGPRRQALYLVIWDGFDQLVGDDALRTHHFAARVRDLAQHGPGYGVGQLVIAQSPLATSFDNDLRLRGLLADNVVALRSGDRAEQVVIAGHTVAPATLPRDRGHALVLTGGQPDPELLHVHLATGAIAAAAGDCETCWQRTNTAAAATTPARFGWHTELQLAAHLGTDGQWRFLNVAAGDELLSTREVADLVTYGLAGAQ